MSTISSYGSIDREERQRIIREWYWGGEHETNQAIHFEILKHTRPKTLDFIGEERGFRMQQAGKIGKLKKILKSKFDVENPLYDFYCSVEYVQHTSSTDRETFANALDSNKSYQELAAKWKTFPPSIENKEERLQSRQLGETVYFPANHEDYWQNYLYDGAPFDLVIDIDGDKLVDNPDDMTREEIVDRAHEEAAKIKSFLDEHNAPYYVSFSGGRGFHLGIQRDHIKQLIDSQSFKATGGQFAKFIEERTGAQMDHEIYTDKRIFRVPYSVHADSGLLCLPLTDDQFENFDLKMAYPPHAKRKLDIRDRGLAERVGRAVHIIEEFDEWKENHNVTEQDGSSSDIDKGKVNRLKHQIKNMSDEEREALMSDL